MYVVAGTSEVIVAFIAEGVGGLGEHNETLQADFNKLITVLNGFYGRIVSLITALGEIAV